VSYGNKDPIVRRIISAEENEKSEILETIDAGSGKGLSEEETIILINAVHTNNAHGVCQDKAAHLVFFNVQLGSF
jgi:hypothetical protein